MAKESGQSRSGSKAIPDAPGASAPADSRQAGERGESDILTINEQGEYCIGTKCFSMRIKPGAGQIRVIVDRNECDADAQAVVDALFGEVVKGVPTVYETKSQVQS